MSLFISALARPGRQPSKKLHITEVITGDIKSFVESSKNPSFGTEAVDAGGIS